MRPLLFLVADKNMAFAVRGFFERSGWHHSVGCAPFAFEPTQDIHVAVGQADPGLYSGADAILRPFAGKYTHAVVMIDEEWDGSPGADRIRARVRKHLEAAGWSPERSLALVLIPEVDSWLWSDSPHSAEALGWPSWDVLGPALRRAGWLSEDGLKPERPKEAAEWALSHAPKRRPRSSSLYRRVTSKVSASRCTDSAVVTLLETLRVWFPVEGV